MQNRPLNSDVQMSL